MAKSNKRLVSQNNSQLIQQPVLEKPKDDKPVNLNEFTPTGIPGFDSLTEGGFPKGSKILVEGKPGTGKSIFALQFLYNGAIQFNEKGLYISFEQSDDKLKKQAGKFGWDLDKAGVSIIFKSPSHIHGVYELMQMIYNKITKEGIKRLVIDSLPALYINATNIKKDKEYDEDFKKSFKLFKNSAKDEKIEPKRFLYEFLDLLRCMPITTLLITENIENQPEFGYTPEYVSEGCVNLTFENVGMEVKRFLTIRKMRYINNNLTSQEFSIVPDKGIIMSNLN